MPNETRFIPFKMLEKGLLRVCALPVTAFPKGILSTVELQCLRGEIAELSNKIEAALHVFLGAQPESEQKMQWINARRAWHKGKVLHLTNLPAEASALDALYRQYKSVETTLGAQAGAFETAYLKVLESEMQAVFEFKHNPAFAFGLVCASRALSKAVEKTTPNFSLKKDRQIALALYQYGSRSTFKTSPFSTFCAVAPIWLAKDNPPEQERLQIAPNTAFLELFYFALLSEPEFCAELVLRSNPSLEFRDKAWHFLYFDGKNEGFQTLQFDPSVALMLEIVDNHPGIKSGDLAARLTEKVEASAEEIADWIQQMVEVGLLEYLLPVAGFSGQWSADLADFLEKISNKTVAIAQIETVLRALKAEVWTGSLQPKLLCDKQETAAQALQQWIDKTGISAPPVQLETVFYVDHVKSAPNTSVNWADKLGELRDILRSDYAGMYSERRADAFFRKQYGVSDIVDFQHFVKCFLQKNPTEQSLFSHIVLSEQNLGAVVQWVQSQGKTLSVLNDLFYSPGRMFARWAADLGGAWEGLVAPKPISVTFEGFGFSNANFHPESNLPLLVTPGGRVDARGGIPLREIGVGIRQDTDCIGLFWCKKAEIPVPIELVDRGLESIETRTPALQLLCKIGITKPFFNFQQSDWEQRAGVKYRPRIQRGSWILDREQWRFTLAKTVSSRENAIFFRDVNFYRLELGMPDRVFWKIDGEKPQYLDFGSPISVRLLQQTWQQNPNRVFTFAEMLPLPEQIDGLLTDNQFASELAVEFSF